MYIFILLTPEKNLKKQKIGINGRRSYSGNRGHFYKQTGKFKI